jgi:hypothetical protein
VEKSGLAQYVTVSLQQIFLENPIIEMPGKRELRTSSASVIDSVVPKIPVFVEELRGRERNKGTSAYNQYDPTNYVTRY